MSSIILTHGDCDGICSAAIAKSAIENASVFFTSPVSLLNDLNNLKRTYEEIVICDIAVDEKTCSELKSKLNELMQVSKVTYIDHHPLPERGFSSEWFYHDKCSAAELTYRIFEDRLDRDIRRVAIYGAIGDFSETSLIRKWELNWDRRTMYFFAGMLVQGITEAGRNYNYKRDISEELSEDMPPYEIKGLLDSSIIASKKEENIMSIVKQKVVKMKNLAYVINVNGYLSKAAIYAAAYGEACVGVSCEYRAHKHVYDLSVRSRGSKADLNKILRNTALNHDGTGGGHPSAGGARIPEKHLEAFLCDLDNALGA